MKMHNIYIMQYLTPHMIKSNMWLSLLKSSKYFKTISILSHIRMFSILSNMWQIIPFYILAPLAEFKMLSRLSQPLKSTDKLSVQVEEIKKHPTSTFLFYHTNLDLSSSSISSVITLKNYLCYSYLLNY